jgi:hypothetical protein
MPAHFMLYRWPRYRNWGPEQQGTVLLHEETKLRISQSGTKESGALVMTSEQKKPPAHVPKCATLNALSVSKPRV